MSRVTPL